jgi:hypothetical protein
LADQAEPRQFQGDRAAPFATIEIGCIQVPTGVVGGGGALGAYLDCVEQPQLAAPDETLFATGRSS